MDISDLSKCGVNPQSYDAICLMNRNLNNAIEKINEYEIKIGEMEKSIDMLINNQLEISGIVYKISKKVSCF